MNNNAAMKVMMMDISSLDKIAQLYERFSNIDNEEKQSLLNFYESLKRHLKKHSKKHHQVYEHTNFAGSLVDPPDVEYFITGTEYPFKECAFDCEEVIKTFEELCDTMEKSYFEV